MDKEKVHFFFDESGEKGFVDLDCEPELFGLIAGIAFPSRNLSALESKVSPIFGKLDSNDFYKVHATEIFSGGKNSEIRDELFDLIIREKELLIISEAAYPKGVAISKNILDSAIEKNKPKNPKVNISKHQEKVRLYNTLLSGIIIKLDELCKIKDSTDLLMITDRIDRGLWKEASELLKYLRASEHVRIVTGFDPELNKVLKGEIRTKIKGDFDIAVKHIKGIEIGEQPSKLTLVADIVCNSIYHFLQGQIAPGIYPRLNAESTFRGFPLASKIAFLDDNHMYNNLYSPA